MNNFSSGDSSKAGVPTCIVAVGSPDFERARNIILLVNEGQPVSEEADKWLTDYMLSCPIEQIDELQALQNRLEE